MGSERGKKNTTRIKRGNETLSLSLASLSFSVHQWSVMEVIEIDFQVNYFVCPSVSGSE